MQGRKIGLLIVISVLLAAGFVALPWIAVVSRENARKLEMSRKNDITASGLSEFAQRLAVAYSRRIDANAAIIEARSNSAGQRVSASKDSCVTKVVSTDIVQTASLEHPIVGRIEMFAEEFNGTEEEDDDHFSVDVVRRDGRWVMLNQDSGSVINDAFVAASQANFKVGD